ncbi:MAG: CpsD/CapB family tyrosine-protein kinase [Acidobacteriota bacterium]
MTRLREALERAQTLGENPADTASVPAPDQSGEPAPALGWQLDTDEPVTAQASQPVVVGREPSARPEPREETAFDYRVLGARTTGKLVVGPEVDDTLVEQYRRLAATLHHAQLRTGNNTVMVTSAVEAEGKTLTAANVALTLSHSYRRRVLLVDADLRRPTVHELFALDNRVGLRDVLEQLEPEGKLPVQQISPTLWVMSAGRPNPDPMSGLISDTMRQFLIDASEEFDWVVIDTPPVALMPDANLLAAMVDAALIVVSASSTPYTLVARAVEAIGAQRVLGVVLNRAERSEVNVGYSYYSYYSSRRSDKSKPRRRFRFALHRKN